MPKRSSKILGVVARKTPVNTKKLSGIHDLDFVFDLFGHRVHRGYAFVGHGNQRFPVVFFFVCSGFVPNLHYTVEYRLLEP